MKARHIPGILVILFAILLALITGCADGIYTGSESDNQPPEIWLSSGPVNNDTTSYSVHFYWSGWDPDGEINFFEFVFVDGKPFGMSVADTMGIDKWTRTNSFDSVFKVEADSFPRPYEDNPLYTRYDRTHTFFIRAVDLGGKRSEPANISFTAWTLAPYVQIEKPVGRGRTYSTKVTFEWTGKDPIDSPSNTQNPDSIRYLITQVLNHENRYDNDFPIIDDLNENPAWYEDRWSKWISYTAEGDSGRSTVIGEDEILELNREHIFAVQAKDEAGAVTALFREDQNVRQFLVSWKAGPLLTVSEPYLGSFRFLGSLQIPVQKDLPPGVPLNFTWIADASDYGGEITGYRYGWDVQDLNNPSDWEANFSPFLKAADERILYSGSHTLYVQVKDNTDKVTLGRILINIIPFSMERSVLWVDDYPSTFEYNPYRTDPMESEHDQFWNDILARVPDFEPLRDQFDCRSTNFTAPTINVVGKYKNIVWTYSSSTSSTLGQVIVFIPESMVGQTGEIAINYIAIFLKKGGHIWTLGRSDRASGGISRIFPVPPEFPAVVKNEITPDPEDTSGVRSLAYKDYCVSVIDKVVGTFKTGIEMPRRDIDRDALRYIYKETSDSIAQEFSAFPEELQLWEGITDCPTCFFNPLIRGFTYVELYNPQYWMDTRGITPLGCFHPLYRMKARSSNSAINDAVCAIILTKYSNITPVVESGRAVAANSFHFGLPLWFFDHEAADSIAAVIFNEWGILTE
ncbi:MAG: hypothetical protein JW814_08435 [Candidatus Krumholzibacteriota bacterium]|nr:hypothetical protein [Candidatus Krumholzibacteriota bacterium]